MITLERKSASSPSRDIQALRMANALQSKTRYLPIETLSYIFQLACQASDISYDGDGDLYKSARMKPFHLVLRLVSVLWYNIVLSTPQLWTSLIFVGQQGEKEQQYNRLCLENSHQFPLSLYVTFPSRYPFTPSMVREVLDNHAHRIQKLQVLCPPEQWCDAEIPNMPQLTELCLYQPVGLPKLTGVQRLCLVGADFRNLHIQPVMASITSLNLQRIAVDFSILLLLRCPNLVEFMCDDHLVAKTFVALPSTISFDHLSTLSWAIPCQNDFPLHNELFEHIRLPSLKRLCLGNPGAQKFELGSPTLTFLSRLPTSINELQFRWMDHAVRKGFLEFFDPGTEVSSIRVDNCSALFLKDIFSSLLRHTDEGNMRFPNLTRIHVGIPAGFGQSDRLTPPLKLWIAQQLLLLLQDRVGTIEWFTFVSETADLTNWDEQIWGQFKQLKNAGLHLTIIEAGEVVDIESRYTKLMEEIKSRAEKTTAKGMRLRSRMIETSVETADRLCLSEPITRSDHPITAHLRRLGRATRALTAKLSTSLLRR